MSHDKLKGQTSKPILVIGPLFGVPNIFGFGLIFAEIFIFENLLPSIVY